MLPIQLILIVVLAVLVVVLTFQYGAAIYKPLADCIGDVLYMLNNALYNFDFFPFIC